LVRQEPRRARSKLGVVPADEDGLAKLVLGLGAEVTACLEMMSGALWVRDRLQAAGCSVEIADARKVKAVAPVFMTFRRVDRAAQGEGQREERGDVLPVPAPELGDRRVLRALPLVEAFEFDQRVLFVGGGVDRL
jgi:hypothetical protein